MVFCHAPASPQCPDAPPAQTVLLAAGRGGQRVAGEFSFLVAIVVIDVVVVVDDVVARTAAQRPRAMMSTRRKAGWSGMVRLVTTHVDAVSMAWRGVRPRFAE